MRALRWPKCWLALWLGAIVAVIVLSLVPPPPMPAQTPHHFDKLLHFGAYFALMFAAVQLFARLRVLLPVALALAALGVLMELAQAMLVPHLRMLDVWDALANAAGVLVALLLANTPLATWLQRLERRIA